MTKRRSLGRGLSALIPDSPAQSSPAGEGLRQVPVTAISPNPHQPRAAIDEEKLSELAASIDEHGLIQPLIVNEIADGTYHLIAGERRWRAAQRAGLETIPVVVKEATPLAMLELALIENIQRADLNPLEEAHAYRQLIDEFGMTQEKVARRMGKSRPAIANTLRLLNLPQKVQAAVIDGKISAGHARALVALPTEEIQLTVLSTILAKGLSVRQTETLVDKLKAAEKPKPRRVKKPDPELRSLEAQLRESLGTRVHLQPGPKGKGGRVVIHYYSDEDLQAIFDAIVEPPSR